jgi:hypothetical protein
MDDEKTNVSSGIRAASRFVRLSIQSGLHL